MAPVRVTRRLAEYESIDLLPLDTRAAGVYELETLIEGNSVLSTVFISSADPGATVKVSYYDTTTGDQEGEIYPLNEHPLLSSGPDVSRITVTRIHNKPRMRAEVNGGSVRFSVYLTVVSSFASDLDAALHLNGELVELSRDKGLPIVTWDETANTWNFLKSTGGRIQVDVPDVIQTAQQTINFRRYNQTSAMAKNVPTAHVDYTVPTGYRLFWLAGSGAANSWVKWTVDIAGVRYLTRRSSFDKPDVKLHLGSPLILTAGQRIIITAENIGSFGTVADVETFFYGSLEAL